MFWWVSYIHRDIKTTHNSPPWKLSSLKNERKKNIYISSETMWKNLITQPDDMKQLIMLFFFFIIKFQSMTFTYDDCALYYQIKTLINF